MSNLQKNFKFETDFEYWTNFEFEPNFEFLTLQSWTDFWFFFQIWIELNFSGFQHWINFKFEQFLKYEFFYKYFKIYRKKQAQKIRPYWAGPPKNAFRRHPENRRNEHEIGAPFKPERRGCAIHYFSGTTRPCHRKQ
jgi:hypothetical protein